jgi:rfaE bifunctional protein nucleotidyltransferase chain/domain
MNNIFSDYNKAAEETNRLKSEGKKIVFTNGVFDIIHRGHVEYLTESKSLGDVLVVGLNSDTSVRIIKGEKRPVVPEENRAFVLVNLKPVDIVIIFCEDNPFNVINAVKPDILVKGADWSEDKIIGADIVKQNGGEVKRIKFVENNSSTNIIDEIIKRFCTPSGSDTAGK